MKKLGFLFAMVGAFLMLTTNVMAQTAGEAVTYEIPAMATLNVAGVAPALTFATPAPGEAVAAVESNGSWLNYTSVVASGATNKVTVAISAGTLPTSTTLKVIASADAAAGDGVVGTPSEQLTLTGTAQSILSAIGSCYTGAGVAKGHQLTYEWSVDATGYSTLVTAASASDITITYTIAASI